MTESRLVIRAEGKFLRGHAPEAVLDMDAALRQRPRDAALLLRRGQMLMTLRRYDEALADASRAAALEPSASAFAQRAEILTQLNRLSKAQADIERARSLAPDDAPLRAMGLRLSLQRGLLGRAAREVEGMARAGAAHDAEFYAACVTLKAGRPAAAAAAFARLCRALPPGSSLGLKSRFYGTAAKAVSPAFKRKYLMDQGARKPKLLLCGLGVSPPYTTTLEVLHALGGCDVVFNNVAGAEVRDFLTEFCSDVRPMNYTGRGEAKLIATMLKELRRGSVVGFATRGHPLLFGRLAHQALLRCRKDGIPHEVFSAISSIDLLLTQIGQEFGEGFYGLQVYDHLGLEKAGALDSAQPLLIFSYSGLGRKALERLHRSLRRFYPESQPCMILAPQHGSPSTTVKLGDLKTDLPPLHSSQVLYVPALEGKPGR